MTGDAEIDYISNPLAREQHAPITMTRPFSRALAKRVRRFHRSFPQYKPTPLIELKHLSRQLGVSKIWVKDESRRFGLNAFKVLGASHAIACIVAKNLGLHGDEVSFKLFKSEGNQRRLESLTFVTATDGNHGRAVAWAAQHLGCHSVVYMPKGSSRARFEAIRGHGADVLIIDGNYDDAVRLAEQQAKEKNWILVQDTALEGYETIPTQIMQGYMTILDESFEQLKGDTPTHIFVQCGVGSLAAAEQAYLYELFGMERPVFVVVEASKAACLYLSMLMNDGKPHEVTGDLETIMAGLACGKTSLLAWEILRRYADMFVSCQDSITMKGMRILGNPLPGDPRIISGESGAVTTGLLANIMEKEPYRPISEALGLDKHSTVLLISTEGDTDPDGYRRIVKN